MWVLNLDLLQTSTSKNQEIGRKEIKNQRVQFLLKCLVDAVLMKSLLDMCHKDENRYKLVQIIGEQ